MPFGPLQKATAAESAGNFFSPASQGARATNRSAQELREIEIEKKNSELRATLLTEQANAFLYSSANQLVVENLWRVDKDNLIGKAEYEITGRKADIAAGLPEHTSNAKAAEQRLRTDRATYGSAVVDANTNLGLPGGNATVKGGEQDLSILETEAQIRKEERLKFSGITAAEVDAQVTGQKKITAENQAGILKAQREGSVREQVNAIYPPYEEAKGAVAGARAGNTDNQASKIKSEEALLLEKRLRSFNLTDYEALEIYTEQARKTLASEVNLTLEKASSTPDVIANRAKIILLDRAIEQGDKQQIIDLMSVVNKTGSVEAKANLVKEVNRLMRLTAEGDQLQELIDGGSYSTRAATALARERLAQGQVEDATADRASLNEPPSWWDSTFHGKLSGADYKRQTQLRNAATKFFEAEAKGGVNFTNQVKLMNKQLESSLEIMDALGKGQQQLQSLTLDIAVLQAEGQKNNVQLASQLQDAYTRLELGTLDTVGALKAVQRNTQLFQAIVDQKNLVREGAFSGGPSVRGPAGRGIESLKGSIFDHEIITLPKHIDEFLNIVEEHDPNIADGIRGIYESAYRNDPLLRGK